MKNISENKALLNFLALKNFFVYPVGKKNIAWLENIIARYSLVENTYFLDPSNFTWTTELENNWQIIRKELDVILKFTNQLPSLHDILQCDYGLRHIISGKLIFYMVMVLKCTKTVNIALQRLN